MQEGNLEVESMEVRLGELRSMKMEILFFGGGGGGVREVVSEEVETLGEALPPLNDQLPTTVKN